MTEISFLTGELLLAAFWITVRLFVNLRCRSFSLKREALLLLMYVNLAVLLRITFFPMERLNGQIQPLLFDAARILPPRVNLIPFVHILRFDTKRDMLLNLIGNTAMFVPGGIILPALYPRLRSFLRTAAAGAGISLCIELLQLLFFDRATDIDDLILNTAGCMIGYLIYAAVRLCLRAGRNRKNHPNNRRAVS
ncbi:MAG: VanZ family protein [Oscillospiraceae bacterium]|nr:VanZ family protein [Oscillospiraceae bacterium]